MINRNVGVKKSCLGDWTIMLLEQTTCDKTDVCCMLVYPNLHQSPELKCDLSSNLGTYSVTLWELGRKWLPPKQLAYVVLVPCFRVGQNLSGSQDTSTALFPLPPSFPLSLDWEQALSAQYLVAFFCIVLSSKTCLLLRSLIPIMMMLKCGRVSVCVLIISSKNTP